MSDRRREDNDTEQHGTFKNGGSPDLTLCPTLNVNDFLGCYGLVYKGAALTPAAPARPIVVHLKVISGYGLASALVAKSRSPRAVFCSNYRMLDSSKSRRFSRNSSNDSAILNTF
jgi:hypothetical protein